MAIGFPVPPDDSINILRASLTEISELASIDNPHSIFPREFALNWQIKLPHAVYSLSFEKLLNGSGPETAELTSWRYFILFGDKMIATAQISFDVGTQTHKFIQLCPESQCKNIITFDNLSSLAQPTAGDFEVRLLGVPALHTQALWLKGTDGSADVFRALPLVPDFLEASKVYEREQFVLRLHNAGRAKYPRMCDASS
jgi:hypothetical protein